jgi:hypothetical protein
MGVGAMENILNYGRRDNEKISSITVYAYEKLKISSTRKTENILNYGVRNMS